MAQANHDTTASAPDAHPDLRHSIFEAEDELWTAVDLVEAVYVLFVSIEAPLTERRRSAIMRVLIDAKEAVEIALERWKEMDAMVRVKPIASLDDGNGAIEEAAGDVAVDASRQSAMPRTQSSTITDPLDFVEHLEAINDFAETLVVSVAPSVEMHDKVLGGSVHRLAREIVSRLDAIEELRSPKAAGDVTGVDHV